MMMPTAMSTTLPRMANALNSFNMLNSSVRVGSSVIGPRRDDGRESREDAEATRVPPREVLM